MMEKKIRKKRLLVTASTFPRWKDDTEPRFVLDLASHMTKEFDITVLAPMAIGAKEKEILEGIKVIRYHYFPIHSWETLCYPGAIVPRIKEKKIRAFLVPFLFFSLYINLFRLLPKYDFVHAHWIIPQGIIQSLFKKAYIVTGHGGDVTSLNKGLIKILKKLCLRRASAVTAVSEVLKSQMLELDNTKKIEVISMGCNVNSFGKQFYKENYFQQNEKKVILFVGRLAEKKGLTYLIEAMKMVDAKLIIVGEGPLENELKTQATLLTDKIVFVGAKTHEELRVIYASADIFVSPSIKAQNGDMDGLPTTILEAMASGLPVISSKLSGIAELIEDGENGLLCEQKNIVEIRKKIDTILKNDILYTKLQEKAYNTISKFDYELIAEKYCSLILKTEKS